MDRQPIHLIKDGDHVIFKRKDWCKEGVVGNGKSLMICKLKTKTDSIVGLPYGSIVEWNKYLGIFELVGSLESPEIIPDFDFGESGGDNRNLIDDGNAQTLTQGEIKAMKSKGVKGMELIGNLVQNSSTFSQRQEFGKEKYIKKKIERHIYRFRVLRPNLRLVCEVYGGQRAIKINHLRIDVLAIMLSLSNIHSGSKVVVVDGVQGLLLAAVMERISGNGVIVHIHPGPQPIIPAYDMFGFPDSWSSSIHHLSIDNLEVLSSSVQLLQDIPQSSNAAEPTIKRRKLSETQTVTAHLLKRNQMDSLMIATKLHPKTILLFLLPFLGLSRTFAVHCAYREPLLDAFAGLRALGSIVRISFNDTFLRQYQILDQRTHPENVMNGHGGYFLSGITVEKCSFSSDLSESFTEVEETEEEQSMDVD